LESNPSSIFHYISLALLVKKFIPEVLSFLLQVLIKAEIRNLVKCVSLTDVEFVARGAASLSKEISTWEITRRKSIHPVKII
jgi:hypothetical protein